MNTFDLEKAIKEWRKQLTSHQRLEPGYIEELEIHLRDAIDDLVEKGNTLEEAFELAVSKKLADIEESAAEIKSIRTSGFTPPKALSSWWIPELLPNILKITLRNFKRQPGYSFINISGLAIGIACCMIIFLYVQDELSYDTFHEKADRTYRVDQTHIWSNFTGKFHSTGPAIARALKDELPEIETITRIHTTGGMFITIDDNSGGVRHFDERDVLAADSTFFDVFDFEFIEGEAATALNKPYTFVITEEIRDRYFNGAAALGKVITVGDPGNQTAFQVSGVIKNIPSNSHFDFDLLASMTSLPNVQRRENAWVWTAFVTYMVLDESASIETVEQKLPAFMEKNTAPTINGVFDMTVEQFTASNKEWNLYLTPLTDIRLRAADIGNRIGPVSDIFYVYVFSTVALLIIALASINFMNLSSARSVYRAKEVGVRKTLGSYRSNLISQFLGESVLFSFLSLFLALAIVLLVIEPFNQLALKELSITTFLTPLYVVGILSFTVLIGLIAGTYPALYLTSFSPIEALKNKLPAVASQRMSLSGLRNFLVVFQFSISIMLISSTIIIYQQLEFTQNANLGFDEENVFVLANVEKIGSQIDVLKDQLESEPFVASVGQSNSIPPYIWNEDFGSVYGSDAAEIPMNSLSIDSDFLGTLDIKLAQGKNFEEDAPANANYVILNETAVDQLNWGSEASKNDNFPLGEYIHFSGTENRYQVIGVAKDFNLTSLHFDIVPTAIFYKTAPIWIGNEQYLSIRLQNNVDLEQVIAQVEKTWNTFSAGLPFEYTFLDQELYSQYQAELRIGRVISVFTGLAILIAIMGLIGLISFSIERKTKEIGVRKVMGASSRSIVYLLSKDMTRLIMIAMVIAIPAAWMVMNDWLQNFEYKIDINILVFLAAGLLALILAWSSLSFQAIKAATSNPINSLRSE